MPEAARQGRKEARQGRRSRPTPLDWQSQARQDDAGRPKRHQGRDGHAQRQQRAFAEFVPAAEWGTVSARE